MTLWLQDPRKVSRIEPKQFYASERTFLTWLNMAATIGSIGVAMIAVATQDMKHHAIMGYLAYAFTLVAAIFIIYAGMSPVQCGA